MRKIIFYFLISALFFTFSSNVHAADIKQMLNKNNLPVHITADRLKAFYKKGAYMFIGNVRAVRGDITLTSDKMNIQKDLNTGQIQTITCINDVVITQKDKRATADKAIYENTKYGKITLTGHAAVLSGKNIIKSDRIIYYINKDYAVSQSDNKTKRVNVTIYPAKKGNEKK